MDTLLLILVTGAVAGFAAGLFGVGGGLIFVPALAFAFESRFPAGRVMHMAVATSLATIVPTAVAAAWAHARRGAVRWDDASRLAPGIAAGAAAGALIAAHLGSNVLARAFGVYALAVAAQLAAGRRRPRGGTLRPLPVVDPAGLIVGMLSSLIGIGGGTMTTPYLLWRRRPMHQAVATSAACAPPLALIGCAGYIIAGWGEPSLPAWSSGYVYWPAFVIMALTGSATAPFGAGLAHRLPGTGLKRLFALLLAAVGVKMLLG